MRLDEALEDHDSIPHRVAIAELRNHGVEAVSQDGELFALAEFTHQDRPGQLLREWERIDATPAAVLAWLGY